MTQEYQYQVFHGLNLVPRASARAIWKTRKDYGLEPILLSTLIIKNIKNINNLNFELFNFKSRKTIENVMTHNHPEYLW